MILALIALAAPALAALPDCIVETPEYYAAAVGNPAENLEIVAGPKRMSEVCGAGAVVASGTFFGPAGPLGDVIVNGAPVPPLKERRLKKGSRWIDLGKRWGVGVLNGGRLGISDGDTALRTMKTYLGGGGLLLSDGEDVSGLNESVPGAWGPAFPRDILDDARGRTALGIRDEAGKQTLLVVSTKDAARASAARLAQIMKSLGAAEAVFYDGGGARGFAAGGRCLALPSNKGEDVSPTHVAIRACR